MTYCDTCVKTHKGTSACTEGEYGRHSCPNYHPTKERVRQITQEMVMAEDELKRWMQSSLRNRQSGIC